jgi:hypothetical protein
MYVDLARLVENHILSYLVYFTKCHFSQWHDFISRYDPSQDSSAYALSCPSASAATVASAFSGNLRTFLWDRKGRPPGAKFAVVSGKRLSSFSSLGRQKGQVAAERAAVRNKMCASCGAPYSWQNCECRLSAYAAWFRQFMMNSV